MNVTYTSPSGCYGDNDVISDDFYMPFSLWVTTQYGNASKKHKFTANAPGAHANGGDGKYIISVQGEEIITLHLYDSYARDEIYTKTGKSFVANDIPCLKYNRNYHFTFTKAMNSRDEFYVRIDYQAQSSVDDGECDSEVPVQNITLNSDNYNINVGENIHLKYEIYPVNAALVSTE